MGISVWQLLILLAVVILIFGTKKLKNVGGDLGSAIKSFKTSVKEGDESAAQQNKVEQADSSSNTTSNTASNTESVKKEDKA